MVLLPTGLVLAGAVLGLTLDAGERRRAALVVIAAGLAAGATAAFVLAARDTAVLGFDAFGFVPALWMIAGLVHALAAVAVLGGYRALSAAPNGGQMAALAALSAAAAGLLPGVVDIVALVILLEAVALTGYALVAGARGRRSDEAAMKYFIQGAVATGLLVYALAVLYGTLGSGLSLPDIARAVGPGDRAALTAFALLLAAFAFKLGAFPFHSWAPDAYETAPPSMASFLASGPKLAVLAIAFIMFPVVFSGEPFDGPALWMLGALAVASIVFGNLGGLKQTSYARMLAYSGIAQVGYALVGLTVMHLVGLPNSVPVYLLGSMYAVAAAGAFLAAQAFRASDPAWDGTIAGLAGAGKRRPLLAAAVTVCLLSLTGIPLTGGFWGKFLVFGGAVTTGTAWLAVVGVLGSVVSFGYYGGAIRAMYLDEPRVPPVPAAGAGEATAEGAVADRTAEAAVVAVALVVVAAGVLPLFDGLRFFTRFLALPF